MSGVEVFGLVTGVITVITFASQTTKICKALYDGQSVDEDLQTKARALQAAAETLHKHCSSWSPQSADESKLADIAQGCQKVAVDMVKEINALKPAKQRNALRSFRTAAKSVWKQPKLQKMEKLLDTYKEMLQTGILVRLW